MNMLPSDIGRPIQDITMNLKYEEIVKDAVLALDKLHTKEREAQTKDGHWYTVRLMPYRTLENVIDGVVITFADIDAQKTAQSKLEELASKLGASKNEAEVALVTTEVPLLVLDKELKVKMANEAYAKTFGNGVEVLGKNVVETTNGQRYVDEGLIAELRRISKTGKPLIGFHIDVEGSSGKKIGVNISAKLLAKEQLIVQFEMGHSK
jgi:two-component system CheB/CheR fusion protein